jgi:hypothetical protein
MLGGTLREDGQQALGAVIEAFDLVLATGHAPELDPEELCGVEGMITESPAGQKTHGEGFGV